MKKNIALFAYALGLAFVSVAPAIAMKPKAGINKNLEADILSYITQAAQNAGVLSTGVQLDLAQLDEYQAAKIIEQVLVNDVLDTTKTKPFKFASAGMKQKDAFIAIMLRLLDGITVSDKNADVITKLKKVLAECKTETNALKFAMKLTPLQGAVSQIADEVAQKRIADKVASVGKIALLTRANYLLKN